MSEDNGAAPEKATTIEHRRAPVRHQAEWKQVAIALVRTMGLHHGIWRVYVGFAPPIGINADVNGRLAPAAVLPIGEIGLVEDAQVGPLSVDAAVVNPESRIVLPGPGMLQ